MYKILIDAENISKKIKISAIKTLLNHTDKFTPKIYVYHNWSKSASKAWEKKCVDEHLCMYGYEDKGKKNAADVQIMLDIMRDQLQPGWTKNKMRFCIVSNDTDFVKQIVVLKSKDAYISGIGTKVNDKMSLLYDEFHVYDDAEYKIYEDAYNNLIKYKLGLKKKQIPYKKIGSTIINQYPNFPIILRKYGYPSLKRFISIIMN